LSFICLLYTGLPDARPVCIGFSSYKKVVMNLHKMITLTLLSGAIILATPLVAQRPGSVRGVNERSAPASYE
jgi:hypothetical protein